MLPAKSSANSGVINASFNVPELVTKQLKIQGGRGNTPRKIRLSSNFLPMMGFDIGKRIDVAPGIGSGVEVTFATDGPQKIYSREYKSRKNNPTEAVMELASRKVMEHIPSYIERVHVEMRHGRIQFTPMQNLAFSVRDSLRKMNDPVQMFAALTSGIDLYSAQKAGFNIMGVVEYRPQEARDKTDLTETGLLTATANNQIGLVFNEDIYRLNWGRVSELLDVPHVPVLHVSLQCDHFSNLCPKDVATSYDPSNTRDMFIPFLDGVKVLQPASILIEQVPGFHQSTEWLLLAMQLRRLGYHVTSEVMDSREHGGLTSRKRMYSVASLFPGFEMPERGAKRTHPIWEEYIEPHLKDCRDVSHSKAIQDGVKTGRLRLITRQKPYSPTPVKSQNRMAKDTLCILDGERYLMPSEALLKSLLSIPASFNTEVVGQTIASEIIGQSIDFELHHRVLESLKEHLLSNLGRCTVSSYQLELFN